MMNLDYSKTTTTMASTDSLGTTTVTLVIQCLSLFSMLALTFLHCCSRKTKNQKDSNPKESTNDAGTKQPKGSEAQVDEVIRTDKTQEETDVTQELSNVGGEDLQQQEYSISPYPYEMLRIGFIRRKPLQNRHSIDNQGKHKRLKTRSPRRQNVQQQQQRQQQQQIPRPTSTPNENESKTQASQNQPADVISKPLSDQEKIPFKEKSIAKPSVDLVVTDATQSAISSTQPSTIPVDPLNATTNVQLPNHQNNNPM